MKHIPTVGEHLYLSRRTSDMWVDEVKYPFTVISADEKKCIVQECELVFNGPRYYDTLADDIRENKYGRKVTLRWSEKKQRWQETPADSYPRIATFGEWEFQPYLN